MTTWVQIFFFFFSFFKHLYWNIIASQWYVSFCFIRKRISYTYTYVPISPHSCISLLPHHPSRWSQSTKLISLCYAAASHKLSILHLVVYISPCHSLTSSQLTLPPTPCPQVHSLHLCLYSCPAPRFFLTFFFRFDIYMLAYGICFSLSDFTLYDRL